MTVTELPTPPGPNATPEEVDAYRAAAMEANMKADGVATETNTPADYFGTSETFFVYLPDGISFVEHKLLNEGERRKYLNAINRDVTVKRGTGDATIRTAPGDERHALLEVAIVGWNLRKNGDPVSFSPHSLRNFLENASPRIIDIIEKEIRKANPWLLAEMSVEDIDKEIAALEEMRAVKVKEDAGKANS